MNDCALFRLQQFTYDGTLQDIIQNSGTTNGTFTQPIDLDFDSAGNLYVLDGVVGNNRVQRFDINGNYVSTPIAVGQTGWASFHIHVDENDNIYVSNEGGVVVYTTDGTYVRTIGTGGSGDGQFNQARGVATASNGNIYVADMANSRVQVFDPSGTYLFQFGTLGTADGEFDSPTDIYITNTDEVYVGSNFDDYRGGGAPRVVRVQVFDLDGNFIRALDATNQQFAGDPNIHQYQINGLEVDSSGNVFITDGYLDRIIQYDSNGAFVERIGQRGGEYSEFFGAHHARFHPISGALYVADRDNHRIHIMEEGNRIYSLISSADVVKTDDNESIARRSLPPGTSGINNLESYLTFGDRVVSSFYVDLSEDRNWSPVNTVFSEQESKSLVVNLNPVDAPGFSVTHSLYVARFPGQTEVHVCPDATHVDEITLSCPNGYTLTQGDPDLEEVTINGEDYWKVNNLTGTGAMSEMPGPSPTPTPTTGPGTPTPTTAGSPTAVPTQQAGRSTPAPTTRGPTPTPDGICRNSDPGARVPQLFSAVASSDTSITIYFTPGETPVSGYELEYGKSGEGFTRNISDLGLNSREVMMYTVKDLSSSTEYSFRVRSRNGCKYGSWSNQISAGTIGYVQTNRLSIENVTYSSSDNDTTTRVPQQALSEEKTAEETRKDETSPTILEESSEVIIVVKGTDGKPLAGATVRVKGKKIEAVSDKTGTVRLKGLIKGENTLEIEHEEYKGEQSLYLENPDQKIEIEVKVNKQNVFVSPQLIFAVIIGIIAIGAIAGYLYTQRKK